MFEIDKKKFGAFVAELRREKGYTQKELSEKLFLSDKAVSKWETGASIPDTALLVPLAELLGVTVAELLLCERRKSDSPLDAGQVDEVVKAALHYPEETAVRAYQTKSRWPLLYLCAVIIGTLVTLLNVRLQYACPSLFTALLLSGIFGAYFCFFVKVKLPAFYDQNRCGLYYDGPIRMNIVGVAFNNTNWPHIVAAIRIWACLCTALYPAVHLLLHLISPTLWPQMELYVFLALSLGGLFLPAYIIGKRYE